MPEADSSIPLPTAPESNRAVLQALAEREGLLAPGVSLSPQQMAYAKAMAELVKQGRLGGGPSA
jgi:hypothetical protein